MSGILIIRQPQTAQEFESMYNLRWRILREPWNQLRGSEKDQDEANAYHFIALMNDKIIGTARLHKIKEDIGQVRYLAVEEIFQGKGVGRKLLESIHLTAKNQRFRYLMINAREPAVSFFEKLGYHVVSDGPVLFGEIKHKKMLKTFARRASRIKIIIDKLKESM